MDSKHPFWQESILLRAAKDHTNILYLMKRFLLVHTHIETSIFKYTFTVDIFSKLIIEIFNPIRKKLDWQPGSSKVRAIKNLP